MARQKIIYGGMALVLLALIVWAVRTTPEIPPAEPPADEPRIMSYQDNTLREERDGRTVWTLRAAQMNVDLDTQDTNMQGIEGTFYGEDGRTVTLKADMGYMDSGTRDVVLTGNMYAVTSDGARLRAKELKWTAAESSLAAVGDAEIVHGDIRATGDRIVSSDEFQKFSILGNAYIEKGGAK